MHYLLCLIFQSTAIISLDILNMHTISKIGMFENYKNQKYLILLIFSLQFLYKKYFRD